MGKFGPEITAFGPEMPASGPPAPPVGKPLGLPTPAASGVAVTPAPEAVASASPLGNARLQAALSKAQSDLEAALRENPKVKAPLAISAPGIGLPAATPEVQEQSSLPEADLECEA